jgi:hypothetical protein
VYKARGISTKTARFNVSEREEKNATPNRAGSGNVGDGPTDHCPAWGSGLGGRRGRKRGNVLFYIVIGNVRKRKINA